MIVIYCCWQYLGSSRLIPTVPIERANWRFASVMTTYGGRCWKYLSRKVLAGKCTAALRRAAFQELHSSSTKTLQIYFFDFFSMDAPSCDMGMLIAFPLLP
jgi:hypothetical protein